MMIARLVAGLPPWGGLAAWLVDRQALEPMESLVRRQVVGQLVVLQPVPMQVKLCG